MIAAPQIYTHPVRVYYEDTDAGGVVYYANYLKFAERARTELLRDLSVHQSALLAEQGIAFVVRRAALDLKSPARLDDALTVQTHITQIRAASLHMQQSIMRDATLLAVISVQIACVGSDFKPTRLPKDLLEKFSKAV